jgi:Flp pilus assembly protein TadG
MALRLSERIFSVLRTFARARAGNVSTLFAFTSLPVVAMLGGTTDYLQVVDIRAKLNAAADAAALAAVGKNAMSMSASSARSLANQVFAAQLSGTAAAGYVLTKTPTVSDSGTSRTSAYAFSAEVPTSFLGVFGLSKITVTGNANATATLPVYMDFYLLLDNTPSMGAAATTAGINTMVANTSDQCAFACHDTSTYPNDYYGLAKRLGVTTRIDVMRTATQQLMDTATATQAVSNQFRMAIYTYGASAQARSLTTISSLTSNLSSAKSAAAAIDLMTVPYQNYDSDMHSDHDGILAAVNSAIPNPGSGTSSSAPQKVLFFVSDGVADANYSASNCSRPLYGGYRCQEPLNVAKCTTLKNRGIKIAVLYTTYLPLPTNDWYMSYIAPFSPEIASNMRSCASPGLYFEVSPSGGISEAMNALFKKAVQGARLTS